MGTICPPRSNLKKEEAKGGENLSTLRPLPRNIGKGGDWTATCLAGTVETDLVGSLC